MYDDEQPESLPMLSSSAISSAPPVHISAELTFIVPQDTKPYFESSHSTGSVPKVHFQTEARTVDIRDMRAIAGELSLDVQGFTLHKHASAITAFVDDDEVNARYDAELDAFLKSVTDADRVVVFDRTRRSDSTAGAANRDGLRGPANRVHADYTPKSGPARASDVIGAHEVRRIIENGGRIVQVNVWRPMSGPVKRSPLALADASSVADEELVATDQIFPDRVGEIFSVAYGAGQRWYFAPEIDVDEVIIIKGWDSTDDGRSIYAPHGAFQLPNHSDDLPARESIEVRTYLIFEG
ncbi:MAG: hypothetical protein ACI8PT_001151 [Gammaproteobacteria bacterium]|jgi:hypothetical protein